MFSHNSSWIMRRPQAHRRAVAVIVLVAVCACTGGTDLVANIDTVTYNSALFALNGTPVGSPVAINTSLAATVRIEAIYDFDVAFDLDTSGNTVVYTQRRVGLPLGSSGRQVGLQVMPGAFGAVTQAPNGGWAFDSTLTVTLGQVVALRTQTPLCQFEISPYLYSKFMVDSVSVTLRRIWVTTLTDPDCGFRDLVPGRPKQ